MIMKKVHLIFGFIKFHYYSLKSLEIAGKYNLRINELDHLFLPNPTYLIDKLYKCLI